MSPACSMPHGQVADDVMNKVIVKTMVLLHKASVHQRVELRLRTLHISRLAWAFQNAGHRLVCAPQTKQLICAHSCVLWIHRKCDKAALERAWQPLVAGSTDAAYALGFIGSVAAALAQFVYQSVPAGRSGAAQRAA